MNGKIKYDVRNQRYVQDGCVLHDRFDIDWNRKVYVDMDDKLWFGKFEGETPRLMLEQSDGLSYLKWMHKMGFNLSGIVTNAMNAPYEHAVPDFMVEDKAAKKSLFIDEITLGEPEPCILGSEGDTELARVVRESIPVNLITSNPEAGRSVYTY